MIREALKKYYFNNTNRAEKEWQLAAEGHLPIPASLLKKFETPIDEVYHACSINSLQRVLKNQNKKVQISTFSKGSTGIADGARQTSEVLIVLRGKTSFRAGMDMGDVTDRNGYKWLGRYSGSGGVLEKGFTFPMFDKMFKYFNLKTENISKIIQTVSDLDGKGKAKFIKWYFDESKKYLTKKFLTKIQKDLEDDMEFNLTFNNDEVILHDYKVKNIYIIGKGDSIKTDKLKGRLKALKIPHSGLISSGDVAGLGR